ncbi:MAG: OmpA family protein [Deltaproteobacteria bacterium]|nr:OmpA family protein [Deltaproteobacteria bacterium]
MIPVLTVPAAAGGDFFGNGSVTFTPEVAVSTGRGPVFLGVNLGWRVRGNRDLYGMEIADQVLWRAGTGLDLHAFGLPENLGAGVEFWGLTKAVRPFASAKESPIEALASARYRRGDLLVTAGLGSGVSSGYGAPDFRALAAVAWAPRVAPEPEPPPAPPSPPPPPPTCPDGSTASVSADGTLVCPEVVKDADHDGNPDGVDQCPDEPEDQDGFADDDGCPELDNDDDGIPDHTDQCPNVGEDLEGFEDEDGCPDAERDTDGDGVPDFKDQCSKEPEDMDGFQDEDGCPDHDNDLDGIADSADKCPNEAETINAVEDDDGCPDQGATLVKLTREKIEIKEAVYFDTNSDVIQARSFGLLDQVAAVLQNHAEIPKVRVEGHTDDRGAADYNLDLSQRRAASVMAYLVGKGIAAQRLEAAGFGVTRPIESNKTSRGRERNRRVEFVLVEAAP